MPDRIIGQVMLLVPEGSVVVQLGRPAGLFLLQAGAQQVGEQVMVTPPAAHLIERDQEQSGPFHPLQQRLAALPAGDRVAQFPRHALQDRDFQQERAYLLALQLEHFLGQVVQHIAVAAGERRHEPLGIVLAAQRQRGQLQSRRPSLGGRRQRRHRGVGQGGAGTGRDLPQQGSRFAGGEPQLGGAQLGELAARAQPRQRQRRIGPAGQRQVQPGRAVLEQEAH